MRFNDALGDAGGSSDEETSETLGGDEAERVDAEEIEEAEAIITMVSAAATIRGESEDIMRQAAAVDGWMLRG